MRFVLDPDGVVVADLAGKLPGRGAWISAQRAAVEKAAAKGLFARAFKKPAQLPAGAAPQAFAARVGEGLERRALDALGLARRAGKLAAGFDQAAKALKEKKAAALLIAAAAGADGREKLTRLAADRPIVTAFSSAALSQALGRENVTYAVLLEGPEAARFLREAERFAGYEAQDALAAAPRAVKV